MHSKNSISKTKRILHYDHYAELKEAFTLFDSEQRKALDARELKAAIRAMGFDVKKEQVIKMMGEIGKGSTDFVSMEDFVDIMRDKMFEKGSKEEIMKIFQLFDDEQSGKISFRNLKKIAIEIGENITDDEIRDMIDEADRDGDGALNFEEFYRVMKRRNDDPLSYWSDSD
jgi:Ca2+-binding EF-hand superfamily protein